ncbi:MAG: hypothetical protein FD161_124 [Limisphaerales bacterium]|nr:MAG: hypothetical protein FD161_124 [Limisphaerales bacterium]KAG0510570.1 MAG: hypothetical protein E1N63_124 [Limisphaerales bacterium]TXT52843.1 MAG: hypothetical protein FD140_386 [Limisphaerales bacterium]
MQSATANDLAAVPAGSGTTTAAIPWHLAIAACGACCIPLGALWDISWHMSIGRDTFWTPAHIVIYLGGVVPGLTCGWLALRATFFGSQTGRATTVRFWGARAPLGAWISIWGCFGMLTSAPFDDWWHNTYGLDVQILSPPHSLLAVGMFSVVLGVLLLVLSWKNTVPEAQRAGVARLFVFMVGIMTTTNSIIVLEYSFPNSQHALTFYLIVCGHYPALLVMAARAGNLRWGATCAAGVYMLFYSLMIWLLPLFSAQPMLAPIYNPVTHMVPPPFPVWLVVPAVVLDLLIGWDRRRVVPAVCNRRLEDANATDGDWKSPAPWWRDWLLALALGVAFLGLLLPVQWHFSAFMLSPASDNWLFAGHRHWPYTSNLGPWMNDFWRLDRDPVTARGLAFALALACGACRVGLMFGNWMLKVRR